MKYSVKNTAGIKTTNFLHVFVEQYSINALSYSFSPSNATNLTQVTQLAADLLSNTSLATNLVSTHLPAFGVAAASIRSIDVNSTSVNTTGSFANMTASYTISIEITVVLVRITPIPFGEDLITVF